MLELGITLNARWHVQRAPERIEPGEVLGIEDDTSATREALLVALSGGEPAAARKAEGELTALTLLAGRSVLLPLEVIALPNGAVLEVLARAGIKSARVFAASLGASQGASRLAGAFAESLADVAVDLAPFHSAGVVH